KIKEKKEEETKGEEGLAPDERVIERNEMREVVEKRVKPTVIRRRVRTLESKEPPAEVAPHPPVEPEDISAGEEKVGVELPEPTMEVTPGEVPQEGVPGSEEAAVGPEEAKALGVESEPVSTKAVEAEIVVPEAPEPEEVVVKAETAEEEKKAKRGKKKEKELPGKRRPRIAMRKEDLKKKRDLFEQLVEEEPEEKPEVQKEVVFHPVRRPMKKRVVTRPSKKTEITMPKASKRVIRIEGAVSAGEMAKRMGIKANEIIRKLMGLGVMATINQSLDVDTASVVASEFGYQVENVAYDVDAALQRKEDRPEDLVPRPPVITIMGHVDHGKTLLLDAIRHSNVVEEEAGAITQHIGAYSVELDGGNVVFIDTPGHEAFTALRARGAKVTDIVVLVVAADDGVMPQTIEAIDHAKAADVPIVVAINKIDKSNANPDRVKQRLAELGLAPEEWGGSTLFAEVSAKKKTGIKELLELILLQAELLELKANPRKAARGTVIESRLDSRRGPVATVLVQEGTLKKGDFFVAGTHYGRVRAMVNDRGRAITAAGPSTPVEVIGASGVPEAGEPLVVVESERVAKEVVATRQNQQRERELSRLSTVTLEDLYERMQKGEAKELNVIIKADVQGSVEALRESLTKLSTEAVKVSVIHGGVGAVTESDVNLASASKAIVIGFNVRPGMKAMSMADQEGVDIRTYSVIYDAIEDVKKAMEGFLEPVYKERVIGQAEVLQLFNVPRFGVVAGSHVTSGKIVRGAHARILRDGVVVYESTIGSLKHYKENVKECQEGLDCGIKIENFNDIKPGDVIEAYVKEETTPSL
ncbi:MAG: translation initiation factor IF-2, partial [Deltaproteobacteria bacterium]|nr:translation initiation factor IF-2 [Deltaproteobacteria bacterium]